MGKRQPKQSELFIPTDAILESPCHPFYRQLSALLADAGFGPFV